MAIKHAAVKVSHEILYAAEWNAAHQIDDLTIELVKLVQSVQDLINGALQKAGGTMLGDLTLAGAPTVDLHAATKKYVDDGLAAKLDSPLAVTTSDDLGPYGTGERALDTIYQNTTGKPIYVTIMVTIGVAYHQVALFIGPSSPPAQNVDRFIAGFEADGGAVKILVPTNWYYSLDATAGGEQNIDAWIEQTLG